jgi:hypothetical protein
MVSTAEVVDRLERRLMSLGVYVERNARESTDDGERLHVEYETAAGDLAPGDVGNVCTELVAAHENGWEPKDCRFWAFAVDGAGEFLGDWAVREGWFHALDRGDLTETDFSTLVLSTRRRPEDPPRVE